MARAKETTDHDRYEADRRETLDQQAAVDKAMAEFLAAGTPTPEAEDLTETIAAAVKDLER